MKIDPNSYLGSLLMIGFIVFGMIIGVVFGFGFVALDEAGAFTQPSWELIESPIRFNHIADATTQKIWAITEENKYYCLGFPNCDEWTETQAVSVNSHEEPGRTIITKDTCKPYGKIKYPSDPKGNVIECARSSKSIQIEAQSIVYYALLDDGTIWVWSSSGPWYVGFGIFVELFCPLAGLFFGFVPYMIFGVNRKNRNKLQTEE
jgi:hypothetical protein